MNIDEVLEAIRKDEQDKVERYLESGGDINARSQNGFTMLYEAAWDGRTDIASLLIAKGADIHCCDNVGNTPLHTACWFNHPKIASMLLTAGASLDLQNDLGRTPYFEATPEVKAILESHEVQGQSPAVEHHPGISL